MINIVEKIKKETGIDVTLKCRRKENVELKAMASYILRQNKLSLTQIGEELKLNHATIIHHLKRYDSLKFFNTELQDLEDLLLGKVFKGTEETKALQKIIKEQEKKIAELNFKIAQYNENRNIKRLIALLDNKDIEMKFNAFVEINEKASYYKKYEL